MIQGRILHIFTAVTMSVCLIGCGGSSSPSDPKEETRESEGGSDAASETADPEDAAAADAQETAEEAAETGEEETAPGPERKTYSSGEIRNACIYYCLSEMDQWYPLNAEIAFGMEEDDLYGDIDNSIEVRLFESSEAYDVTIDRYTIDTASWKGTDFIGNGIDLHEALSSVFCDEDLQTLMTAAGCLFGRYHQDLPQDMMIREDALSEAHLDTFAVQAFYRIGTATPSSEMDRIDNYFIVDGEEMYDLFRNTLGPDAQSYLDRAVDQDKENMYPAFIREDDHYGMMGLTLTDPVYFFRPLSEEEGQTDQERIITAELVYFGNTLARSRGLYKISLTRDPGSAYGWVLSRIKAMEPEFRVESISASSTLDGYPAENMLDRDMTTTWAEGEGGYGEGTTITLTGRFPARVHGIRFGSGFLKSTDLFEKNGSPTEYTVILDGKTRIITGGYWPEDITPLHLEDPYSVDSIINGTDYQGYSFTDAVSFGREFTASEITIRIDQVRYGTRYEDTCISEIYVY